MSCSGGDWPDRVRSWPNATVALLRWASFGWFSSKDEALKHGFLLGFVDGVKESLLEAGDVAVDGLGWPDESSNTGRLLLFSATMLLWQTAFRSFSGNGGLLWLVFLAVTTCPF